jgi:hypothetical protein
MFLTVKWLSGLLRFDNKRVASGIAQCETAKISCGQLLFCRKASLLDELRKDVPGPILYGFGLKGLIYIPSQSSSNKRLSACKSADRLSGISLQL